MKLFHFMLTWEGKVLIVYNYVDQTQAAVNSVLATDTQLINKGGRIDLKYQL